MKKLSISIGLVLLGLMSMGQTNLVINPDFEIGPVPTARGQISYADYWTDDCTDPLSYGGTGVDLLDRNATLADIQVPINVWGAIDERTGDDRYAHIWQAEESSNNLVGERLKGELTSALPKGNYDFCFWAAVAPSSLNPADEDKQIVEVFLVNGNDCPADGILIHTTAPVPYNAGTPIWIQYCSNFEITTYQANLYDRIVFQLKDPEGEGVFWGHNQSVYIDEVEINKDCDDYLDLGEDITLCIGESTTLDITGQVPPGTTVAWFLDGVGIAAPIYATSIVISTEGTYTVTGTDKFGCTYTESINVVVIDCDACGFIANINSSVTGCTVSFSSMIAVEYGDPSPTIIGYLWVFGDGNTSTEMNPSHLYTSPGSHTVTLFIYGITPNGDCCVVKVTKVVETTVGCMPICFISASFSKTEMGGGNFNFTSTSFSNDFTSILGYEWTINGTVVSNDETFNYPFTGGLVCLTVYGLTELGGCCTKEVCVNYTSGNNRRRSDSDEEGSKIEANSFGMRIFPNPANANLKVELELEESQSATITIVDVTGKEVYKTITTNTSFFVETTEFTEGVYFLSVSTKKGNLETMKVIIQH